MYYFKANVVTVSALVLPFFLLIVHPDSHDDFAGFVPLCLSISVTPRYIASLIMKIII